MKAIMWTLPATLVLAAVCVNGHLPVLMWHGMGDNCCSSGMRHFKEMLEDEMPGVYVHSVMIGSSPDEDSHNSIEGFVPKQVEQVCQKIKEDPKLAHGYNAIGFSQGGLFLRAVAQMCPHGMHNLISVGGPHQGIYDQSLGAWLLVLGAWQLFGWSTSLSVWWNGAYSSYLQHNSVQAQFWHDPLQEETYRDNSHFLASINNARPHVDNQRYKDNLTKLNKLVLVKFTRDTVLDPIETQWFGFYHPGQATTIQPFNETELYKEDWIGLRTLDESDRLDLLPIDRDHMDVPDSDFKYLIKNYLALPEQDQH